MEYKAKYNYGDVVLARHSGKSYVVLATYPLDETGCFACSVRGWRGGNFYGPTRQIAESMLDDPHEATNVADRIGPPPTT